MLGIDNKDSDDDDDDDYFRTIVGWSRKGSGDLQNVGGELKVLSVLNFHLIGRNISYIIIRSKHPKCSKERCLLGQNKTNTFSG